VSQIPDDDRQKIVDRYARRFEQFGIDNRTLKPGTDEHYRRQHEVHASIGDLNGKVLLDVGCGLANYYLFLRSRGIQLAQYIGYDIVPKFIDVDRERFPEATFALRDVSSEGIGHEADYVVMCQVFNNRFEHADNGEVVRNAIRVAQKAARIGVSIDLLSTYVNYREDFLYYFSPEEMFAYAKSLARFVILRHDYADFHFTLFLYKDQA
jgi:ubiquinone/menaquinone biosynthesis C-methylase UbiE